MAITSVKQREFVREFGKYKSLEVQVVDKSGGILGIYRPESVDKQVIAKIEDVENGTTKANKVVDKVGEEVVDKKAIADEIVDKVESGVNMRPKIQEQEEAGEIVGNCAMCKQPKTDLWIWYGDGEDHEVCQKCLIRGRPTSELGPAEIKAFLGRLTKVQARAGHEKVETPPLGNVTKCEGVRAMPKPVKKKKK